MSGGHDDFAFEPIRGLPAVPPEGEQILWQGAPDFAQIARHFFMIRPVAAYFALLMCYRGLVRIDQGGHGVTVLLSALSPLPMALLGLGLLLLLAKLCARTSVYTLTSKRIVMRVGVALPITINLPLKQIASADLRQRGDGSGDIILTLLPGSRVAYIGLWPHVAIGRFNHPQPILRGLTDAASVAEQLCRAAGRAVPDLRATTETLTEGNVQYT